MAIEAVLLDFDGVVANTMPLHRLAWLQFFQATGHDPSPEDIASQDGKRAVDVVQHFLGPMEDWKAQRLAEQREGLFLALQAEQGVAAMPGVVDFLVRLQELKRPTALVTSGQSGNIAAMLAMLALPHAFDLAITAQDVRHGKPDPEAYLTAAKGLGFAPELCLVVEDALPGVLAGVAAGACVLAIAPQEQKAEFEKAGACWVVPDFYQLPDELWQILSRH